MLLLMEFNRTAKKKRSQNWNYTFPEIIRNQAPICVDLLGMHVSQALTLYIIYGTSGAEYVARLSFMKAP